MCGSAPSTPEPAAPPPAPSKREKTALELRRPEDQRKRQALAAELGVQQLRSTLVNAS